MPAAKLEGIGVGREKEDVRFVMANGEVITRNAGFAILRVDKPLTIDEVVFAGPVRPASGQLDAQVMGAVAAALKRWLNP